MSDEIQTPPNEPATAARPENLPEQFWDAEKGAVLLDDLASSYADLSQQVQIQSDLASALPENAEGYELGLPDDFEAPEGFEFTVEGDERVGALRDWAHANKIQPSALKALMGIYAQDQAEAHQVMSEEMASLGSNAKGRIADLAVALNARLPNDEAQALAGTLGSAAAVRAVEKLIAGRGSAAPAPHQKAPDQDDLMAITDPVKRLRAINAQKGKAK